MLVYRDVTFDLYLRGSYTMANLPLEQVKRRSNYLDKKIWWKTKTLHETFWKRCPKRTTSERQTWWDVLVPAVELRLEGGEDGTGQLCSPFIFTVGELNMQTELATSGTFVHLSALLFQAPKSYKSTSSCEPCINPTPIPKSAQRAITRAPDPCFY